jgi:hypothetical protein
MILVEWFNTEITIGLFYFLYNVINTTVTTIIYLFTKR